MVQLLPAESTIGISGTQGSASAASLARVDAAAFVVDGGQPEQALRHLPHAALWIRLYRSAARAGKPPILATRLPALFRTQPARYWMERLWAHEVACLPLQPPGLVFDDEQIRHAGVMTTVEDPELGELVEQ